MQKWVVYLNALREGRDTAEFRADAEIKTDDMLKLQALINKLGEDKLHKLLKSDIQ